MRTHERLAPAPRDLDRRPPRRAAARAGEHDREPRFRRELRRGRRRVRRAPDARRRGRALPRRGRRPRHAAHSRAQLHLARAREALDPVRVRRLSDPPPRAGLPSLRARCSATSSRSRPEHGMQHGTMARRIAKLAAAFGIGDRCLVASFDAEFLKRMRETAPEIATSFLFDHPVALPAPGTAGAALSARGRDRPETRPRRAGAARVRPLPPDFRSIPGPWTIPPRSGACSARASARSPPTLRTRRSRFEPARRRTRRASRYRPGDRG